MFGGFSASAAAAAALSYFCLLLLTFSFPPLFPLQFGLCYTCVHACVCGYHLPLISFIFFIFFIFFCFFGIVGRQAKRLRLKVLQSVEDECGPVDQWAILRGKH